MLLTCTGASGAPKTPSNNLRSDRWQAAEEEAETEGALQSWPFIQWPHLSILESPPSDSSGSGPSINGDSASAGLKLPDLDITTSGCTTWPPLPLLLLRSRPDRGDTLRPEPGLLPLVLAGDSPLTTEKNPCFLSILTTKLERERKREKR